MRSATAPGARRAAPSGRRRLWPLLALVLVPLAALSAAALLWSGATLAGDPVALARVEVQPLGGKLQSAKAFDSRGRPLALTVQGGRLTPKTQVAPGESISVEVVVRRPGWLGWALGKERRERLTVRAPVARVTERWLTRRPGSPLQVRFDHPVAAVALGRRGAPARRLARPAQTVGLGGRGPAGAMQVAAAARGWESLGAPARVTWFPPARSPVAIADPAPGASISPAAPIRLTFSKPVADVLGSEHPKLSPPTPGKWRQADSHTLVFRPSGFGAPLGSRLRVDLPHPVALTGLPGHALRSGTRIEWVVPPGSITRLHQLLAEAGYLPVDWTPDGAEVARTPSAQVAAAVHPPRGSFGWRYPNVPGELSHLWSPDSANAITRGAVMMFQDRHGLAVDGAPGPVFWRALLSDTIAGKRSDSGYSYVYVHRKVPQLLTLWHNGSTILRSPGNTGVPAAPTQLGTFPVFEHLRVGTMSGTNPDGTKYHDPGIKWISYFNGGDALHSFNRASFGTPQSLGCVELPMAAAAKIWPYTPIGALVTIED
jgi:hypothetical protein